MPGAAEVAEAASDSAVPVWYWIVTACGAIVTALGGAKIQQQRTPAPACPVNGRLDAVSGLSGAMADLAQSNRDLGGTMVGFCARVGEQHQRHTDILAKVLEVQQQQAVLLSTLVDRTPRT